MASGHFYTEPTIFGDKHELAFVVWEEGVVCIATETYMADKWIAAPGPECGFPGEDRFPSYCEIFDRLYFTSSRSMRKGNEPDSSRIWHVTREKAEGWKGQPQLLDLGHGAEEIISLSVTAKGDLYFEGSGTCLAITGSIFCSVLNEDQSRNLSEVLVLNNPHKSDKSPCVAPDGSFLVFNSSRPGGFGDKDLYVVFQVDARIVEDLK